MLQYTRLLTWLGCTVTRWDIFSGYATQQLLCVAWRGSSRCWVGVTAIPCLSCIVCREGQIWSGERLQYMRTVHETPETAQRHRRGPCVISFFSCKEVVVPFCCDKEALVICLCGYMLQVAMLVTVKVLKKGVRSTCYNTETWIVHYCVRAVCARIEVGPSI